MTNDCEMCRLDEPEDQKVVLRDRTVLFLQNEKEQGALRGSGVIIPVRHAETVFDLTSEEIDATFALLRRVIPRFRQEPYAGRGIRYWLKQPANRWW